LALANSSAVRRWFESFYRS